VGYTAIFIAKVNEISHFVKNTPKWLYLLRRAYGKRLRTP